MYKFAVTMLCILTISMGSAFAEDAKNIYQDAIQKYQTLDSYEADYTLKMRGQDAGLKGHIALRNKNDLYFSLGDENDGLVLYGNNEGSTLVVPGKQRYMETSDPQFAILGNMGSQAINSVFKTLTSILQNDPKLMELLQAAEIKEELSKDGVSAKKIALDYGSYAVDAVIADDTKLIHSLEFRTPATSSTVMLGLTFENIVVNHQIEDKVFAYSPAKDTELVDSPNALFAPKENVKIGQAAPGFTLANLSGEKIDLKSHKGKEVVLLDFFASWCGPCRMGMPIIDELAGEYKDKGVAFYAVNLREGQKVAQSFKNRNNLEHVDVLLDLDGKIGLLYDAQSIPRTVIIDKDGNVSAIHRGFSQNLKEEVKKDLDKIL